MLEGQPEISLLFTGVVVPEMTGRQLADQVAHRSPQLPVLYATGYTRNAIVHTDARLGRNSLAQAFILRQLAVEVRQAIN